jgi:CubicO group peptidase (beta-lactamase class C family)
MAQPGERWMYQVSADVLGVLIARVSGQSLGTFMRQRIFEPLGMRDTAPTTSVRAAVGPVSFSFASPRVLRFWRRLS